MKTSAEAEPFANLSKLDLNKTHAALFNLIIYTQSSARLEYCKKIVKMVTKQFPCRIFLIQNEISNDQSSLKLNPTVAVEDKSHPLPCDTINLIGSGEGIKRIPYLILPHLIPDLPIYLFWDVDPIKETTILPYLQPLATRLIFDSEGVEDLPGFFCSMMKQLESSRTEIIDMNWVRTEGWRQIIAKTFDSKERIDLLERTTLIKIIYNKSSEPLTPFPQTQAIYLQAWLANRLGWSFEKMISSGDSTTFFYRNQHPNIQIQLIPRLNKELAPQEIIECSISDPDHFVCDFTRAGDHRITVKASDQYECRLPFTLLLPSLQSGRNFVQEIFYQKMSEQYPKILKQLNEIDWRGVDGSI